MSFKLTSVPPSEITAVIIAASLPLSLSLCSMCDIAGVEGERGGGGERLAEPISAKKGWSSLLVYSPSKEQTQKQAKNKKSTR